MRRQNPPQTYVEKAQRIERYLRPHMIASAYAAVGIFYALLISAIFGILVHKAILQSTALIIVLFVAIALIPVALAFLGYSLSPRDPLSHCVTSIANEWRRPLDVSPRKCTFRELLMNGEAVCLKVNFYYSSENQSKEIKERLYRYVHTALGNYCSERIDLPTPQEVENIIDVSLSRLAFEYRIAVLYSEIEEIYPIQAAFNFNQNTIEAQRLGVSA